MKLTLYLTAPFASGECHAWFHLHGLCRAVKTAKQAIIIKWKVLSYSVNRSITFWSADWQLHRGTAYGRLLKIKVYICPICKLYGKIYKNIVCFVVYSLYCNLSQFRSHLHCFCPVCLYVFLSVGLFVCCQL